MLLLYITLVFVSVEEEGALRTFGCGGCPAARVTTSTTGSALRAAPFLGFGDSILESIAMLLFEFGEVLLVLLNGFLVSVFVTLLHRGGSICPVIVYLLSELLMSFCGVLLFELSIVFTKVDIVCSWRTCWRTLFLYTDSKISYSRALASS